MAVMTRALLAIVVMGLVGVVGAPALAAEAHGPVGSAERYAALATSDDSAARRTDGGTGSTPALPDWPDQASVYDRPDSQRAGGSQQSAVANDHPRRSPPTGIDGPHAVLPNEPDPVRQADYQDAGSTDRARDRRSPAAPIHAAAANDAATDSDESGHRVLGSRADDGQAPSHASSAASGSQGLRLGLPLDAIYTTGTALAVVIGLVLLCAWALRRGSRKTLATLPEDAVGVLGQVPLAARQTAQLVRVGSKLVLLSVTPDGATPLTEITDTDEVQRLLGVCRQAAPRSSSSEFDHVFRELAQEAAPGEFLGREATQLAARIEPDAYAAYRGGARGG